MDGWTGSRWVPNFVLRSHYDVLDLDTLVAPNWLGRCGRPDNLYAAPVAFLGPFRLFPRRRDQDRMKGEADDWCTVETTGEVTSTPKTDVGGHDRPGPEPRLPEPSPPLPRPAHHKGCPRPEGVNVLADMLDDLCSLCSGELKSWEEPARRRAADCIGQLERLLDRGRSALGRMRATLLTPSASAADAEEKPP